MKTTTLPVATLEVCDRVRVRAWKPKDGSEVVQEYAEAYECGLITEPLDVFREKGTERYIVADGENRLLALRRAKVEKVECRLYEGDEIAALDFAIGCNQAHGLRRTKADKYHALARIMETPTLRSKYKTDTDLSEKIGVSVRTVASYKAQWRESDGGTGRTKAKKEQAKEHAAKHEPKGNLQLAGSKPPKKQEPAKKSLTSTLTTEHKKVAAQVRESVKVTSSWTAADEHAYKLLISAWSKSTAPSRNKFLAEIGKQDAA